MWKNIDGVFNDWGVGRILLKGTDLVLFPPFQPGFGSGPVYTGVSIRPGETPSIILREIQEYYPKLKHYKLEELQFQVHS